MGLSATPPVKYVLEQLWILLLTRTNDYLVLVLFVQSAGATGATRNKFPTPLHVMIQAHIATVTL